MINTIDISGKWELFISENNRTSLPDNYNDSIILPDTLSDAADHDPLSEAVCG